MGPLEGCYKIGRSADPAKRAAILGVHLPVELSVVAVIRSSNTAWLESYLHAAFLHCHARGEWFRLNPHGVALIQSVASADSEDDLPPEIVSLRRSQEKTTRLCGPGRPRTLPPDTFLWSVRVTERERKVLVKFLERMRAKKKGRAK